MILVDEAAMVGTPQLRRLLETSTAAQAKIVLVGDAYQLSPVKARGGMFEHLCQDLPWAQRLSEVWRLRDPAERDASLALPYPHAATDYAKPSAGQPTHDRLHTGDPIAMATVTTTAYIAAHTEGKDVAILCDRSGHRRRHQRAPIHHHFTNPDTPSVPVARDQPVRAGDLDSEPPQRHHRDRSTRHTPPPR